MKADATDADAAVHVTLGSAPSEVWLTYRLRFDSAALAFWTTGGAFFHELRATPSSNVATWTGISDSGSGPQWVDAGGSMPGFPGVGGTPVADAWLLIEVHVIAGTLTELFVDGVSQYSWVEDTGDTGWPEFYLGLLSTGNDPASVAYFDDVKVGTTRGGSDLFSDDFESGTFSAWSDTFGAVSIVSEPATILARVFSPDRFYEAPPWRIIVSDLQDRTLTYLDHLAMDRSITVTRAAARVMSCRVPSDNPEVNIPNDGGSLDQDPFVAEGTRIVSWFRREGRVGEPAGKVLRADGTGGDAFASFDFPSDETDVWVTFDVAIPAATLASWTTFSGYMAALWNIDLAGPNIDGYVGDFGGGLVWSTDYTQAGVIPPTADAWQTIEYRAQLTPTDELVDLYVDAALADTGTASGAVTDARPHQQLQVGIVSHAGGPVYYRNVKVGTTRGGSDVFDGSVEDGTLDAWTAISGEVSVVDDPFASASLPQWRIRGRGLVLDVDDSADSDHATSTVTAYDPWKYLYRRPVLLADGSYPGTAGRVYAAGARASDIIVEQFTLAETYGTPIFTDYGLTSQWAGTIETTDPLPDGGDGLAVKFAAGTSLGEMLDTLVATGTCDVVFDPVYDPVLRPGVLCDLSIYQSAGEFQAEAIFGWDSWPRSLVQLSRQTDGTARMNRARFFAGQGGPPVPEEDDAASIAKFGDYWGSQYLPGVPSIAGAHTIAQRQLALLKDGQLTYALTPAAERAPLLFQEYREADTVPVYASKRFRAAIPGDRVRIESIPVVIGDDQLERVNQMLVSFSPETGS